MQFFDDFSQTPPKFACVQLEFGWIQVDFGLNSAKLCKFGRAGCHVGSNNFLLNSAKWGAKPNSASLGVADMLRTLRT
eukprot:NODE_4822_length_334_cov_0.835088_g4211_i0.p1 GENE.NODE_4822_length_334_cov_0.835088_g4211_i0~~NODE_4822_length_334_cov_0.835088_g4211_i0.p1  ORF type:complete len:78 (+),score=1.61 NODE_4822_length_334_cov_0.835088_g4211_i0:72-305(+)